MNDFIAAEDLDLLQRHHLASFEALWTLDLPSVDEPNTGRGGFSSVSLLTLEDRVYFLKRQSDHLSRDLLHPFGRPTFAKEFVNIRRFAAAGISAPSAAYFAQRKIEGRCCAILMTHALMGWQDLTEFFPLWPGLSEEQRKGILQACGRLAARLHGAGLMHGCFYPKHIFLRPDEQGYYQACLIDLEKARRSWLGQRDRINDLETLLRRAVGHIGESGFRQLLVAYLNDLESSAKVEGWWQRLQARNQDKEKRP